ncbi:MAG: hypothetical protein NVS4B12_17880 [Ktedonobacteraceae bacterium]
MQNSETSKRWSDIHNIALVTIDTGKKVGTLEDFYFEPRTNSVYALYVKTGVFGHRALKTSSVNAIGTDAITFTDESSLIEEKEDALLSTLPLGRALLTYKVLSEGGTVIGTVGNILFDTSTPANLRVTAFELAGGLRNRLSGRYPTFSSAQVVRYGADVLVIPDAVALPLTTQ